MTAALDCSVHPLFVPAPVLCPDLCGSHQWTSLALAPSSICLLRQGLFAREVYVVVVEGRHIPLSVPSASHHE